MPRALARRSPSSIDGNSVTVPLGTTILEAAHELQIHIPTLCFHEDLCLAGVCRICVVEIEGQRTLQAACSYPITSPIRVSTHTAKVRRARRHVLDLLLASHLGECYACSRNNYCELQSLAAEYGVDLFRFGHLAKPRYQIDASSHSVVRDMNKCVLCRRCVRTCIDLQEVGVLEALHRGHETKVGTFMDKPLADVVCINCGQCINRCPTGALRANDLTDEVWQVIDDPTKHVVIQTAPSPRAGIGECFGLAPGHPLTFEMNTALRRCGFDRVFDTNFAADLTIMEEGVELLLRLHQALVAERPGGRSAPIHQLLAGLGEVSRTLLSRVHPESVHGQEPAANVRRVDQDLLRQLNQLDPKNVVTVALMPCSAKKFECNRPEMCASGYKDIDYGLTTRELAKMIREAGIDLPKLPKSDFDAPFGPATGSGVIFGSTGGVMEAALRTVIELVTGEKVEKLFDQADILPVRGDGGIRYAELPVNTVGPVPKMLQHLFSDWQWLLGATLKVGVCHGTANAKKVMEDIRAGGQFSQCHFIEFMACPGGCLGGGGQPTPTSPAIRAARAKAIYSEDHAYSVRKSHENPAIAEIYEQFLTDGPCGHKSHSLLHTYYTPRGKYII